jgi:hypothetical protein
MFVYTLVNAVDQWIIKGFPGRVDSVGRGRRGLRKKRGVTGVTPPR